MAVGLDAMLRAMEQPCRIVGVLYAQPSQAGPTWKRSYLKSARPPLTHIELGFAGRFQKLTPVPAARAADYDVCLQWDEGYPTGARELITLLTEVLVLPTNDNRLDLAVALDSYKILDPQVASTEWANTEAGDLVN